MDHGQRPPKATDQHDADPLLNPEEYASQHRNLFPRTFGGRAAGTAGGQMVIEPEHWLDALATFLTENRGREVRLAVQDDGDEYRTVAEGLSLLDLEYNQQQVSPSLRVLMGSPDGEQRSYSMDALREVRLLVAADGTPGGLEFTDGHVGALLRLLQ